MRTLLRHPPVAARGSEWWKIGGSRYWARPRHVAYTKKRWPGVLLCAHQKLAGELKYFTQARQSRRTALCSLQPWRVIRCRRQRQRNMAFSFAAKPASATPAPAAAPTSLFGAPAPAPAAAIAFGFGAAPAAPATTVFFTYLRCLQELRPSQDLSHCVTTQGFRLVLGFLGQGRLCYLWSGRGCLRRYTYCRLDRWHLSW